jgi:dihydrofolate reductase
MRGTAWLFGGRRLIRSFMEADLIDNYLIYVMPVLLGRGVPLFSPPGPRFPLRLTRIAKTDEIAKIFYTRDR